MDTRTVEQAKGWAKALQCETINPFTDDYDTKALAFIVAVELGRPELAYSQELINVCQEAIDAH